MCIHNNQPLRRALAFELMTIALAWTGTVAADEPEKFATVQGTRVNEYSFSLPTPGSYETTIPIPSAPDIGKVTPNAIRITFDAFLRGDYRNFSKVPRGATIARIPNQASFDLSAVGAGVQNFPQDWPLTCVGGKECFPFSSGGNIDINPVSSYSERISKTGGEAIFRWSSDVIPGSGTFNGYTDATGSIAVDYTTQLKNPEYIAYHGKLNRIYNDLAVASEIAQTLGCMAALPLCAIMTGIETISDAVLDDPADAVADGILLGSDASISIINAAGDYLTNGSIGPSNGAGLAGTVFGFTTVFLDMMAARHLRLAMDPPDPDYEEVMAFTPSDARFDFGVGSEPSRRFSEFYNAMVDSISALNGALVSLERAQGASNAGDYIKADEQIRAFANFSDLIPPLQSEAGEELMQLAQFLETQSYPALEDNIDLSDRKLADWVATGLPHGILEIASAAGLAPQLIEGRVLEDLLSMSGRIPNNVKFNFDPLYRIATVLQGRSSSSQPVSAPGTAFLFLAGCLLMLALHQLRRTPRGKIPPQGKSGHPRACCRLAITD